MAKNNAAAKTQAEELAYAAAHPPTPNAPAPASNVGRPTGGDEWKTPGAPGGGTSGGGMPGSLTGGDYYQTPGAPGGGNAGAGPGPGPYPPGTSLDNPPPTTSAPPPGGGGGAGGGAGGGGDTTTPAISYNTAIEIIDAALQVVGLDPTQVATSGIDVGQTLAQFFWSQIQSAGLTDSTAIGDMVTSLLPATGQFIVAFPGYQDALKNGYVRTVAQYVSAEEGITATMLQGGIPKDLITPTTVGNLISNGVSVNEVAARVNQGYDAVQNAPAEVQNYFAQEFGAQGPQALATVFLNPHIDDLTLNKMLAGAQVRGAAAASNLTISQGLSQRLADQGQTYMSAQAKFQQITNQAGLFEQTVGEHSSQTPVPGTENMNTPLSASDQGVGAAFGTNANDVQQVHQAALARQNEFRGTGGASSTQAEGYSGLSVAKSS